MPPLVERAVSPGEYVQRQGLPVRQLVAPKVGLLILRRRGPLAADRAAAVVGPGHTLGLRAVATPGVAAVDAAALTPARLCVRTVEAPVGTALPPALVVAWDRLAETLADWATVGRLPVAVQRVEGTLRLLARAQGSSRLALPERGVLGELSGCAPETVSRALAALERAGRLRRGGGRAVELVDPAEVHAARRVGGNRPGATDGPVVGRARRLV